MKKDLMSTILRAAIATLAVVALYTMCGGN